MLLGGHPTVTPPMWTTLACGCYANVHGITCFWRKDEKGYEIVFSHYHIVNLVEHQALPRKLRGH